jgi:hypothetical protein
MVGVQIFFHHFPQEIHVHEKSILLLKFGWRFTNIVQQGSPTQPDIIRIRANIVYDFQRMIKVILMGLTFYFFHLV